MLYTIVNREIKTKKLMIQYPSNIYGAVFLILNEREGFCFFLFNLFCLLCCDILFALEKETWPVFNRNLIANLAFVMVFFKMYILLLPYLCLCVN